MDAAPNVPTDAVHDDTLIDWFLSLTPGERLAELESRLAFFDSVASAPRPAVGTLPVCAGELAMLIEAKKALGAGKETVIALLEAALHRDNRR
jgi:hypothetical protein